MASTPPATAASRKIEFQNGTKWTIADVLFVLENQRDGDRDEILNGTGGADVLAGEGGNDHLLGGAGSDTYIFQRGDGRDVVEDNGSSSNTDILEIRGYLDSEAIFLRSPRNPEDLLIRFVGSDDEILVVNGFSASAYARVEQFKFADGPTLTWAQVVQRAGAIGATDGADYIIGTSSSETLTGGRGNDTIDGGDGADHLCLHAQRRTRT